MRPSELLAAFEASGLDERYRAVVHMAAQGDAFAAELVEDALQARARRLNGLVAPEDEQRRRACAAWLDKQERDDESE